jgi:hypothetical protein
MKPHRMRMTHNLVLNYNLLEHMDVYVSPWPTASTIYFPLITPFCSFLVEIDDRDLSGQARTNSLGSTRTNISIFSKRLLRKHQRR